MKKIFAFAVALFAVTMTSWLGAFGQSPDCSTLTRRGGGTLTTSAGTWSFGANSGGNWYAVLLNGTEEGQGALQLVYNGGNLYVEGGDFSSWYEWNGSGFTQISGDPRGGGCSGGGEGPYGGTAASIPGTVQAENYDTGGQGVGYNVTSVNGTGNSYRSDGVDLEATSDSGGGYNLGWNVKRAVVPLHRECVKFRDLHGYSPCGLAERRQRCVSSCQFLRDQLKRIG